MLYDFDPQDLDPQLQELRRLNDNILNGGLLSDTYDTSNKEEEEEDMPLDIRSIRTESVATTTASVEILNNEFVQYLLPFLSNLIKSFYSFYEEVSEVEQLDFKFIQFRKMLLTKGTNSHHPVDSVQQNRDDMAHAKYSVTDKHRNSRSLELNKLCEILDSILFLQAKLLNSYNNKHNTLKIDYQLDLLYSIFLNPEHFGLKETKHVKSIRLEIFNALFELFKTEYSK